MARATAAETYRVDVRRTSPVRRFGSWAMTLVEATSMVSTSPPWRDEAQIIDLRTCDVVATVRNLVGGHADDVGQVALDVQELDREVFERLWLDGRGESEPVREDEGASS